MTRIKVTICLTALLALVWLPTSTLAWGPQGHRLVAMIAATYLNATARQNVASLLGPQTLADVAVWADDYLDAHNQTAAWHYLNIPPFAASYDRERDCPTQPGVASGSPGDRWRDCILDRIFYNQERIGNATLDRSDRAVALKWLVHLVADLHQPFHVLGVEKGGKGIPVIAFGSSECVHGTLDKRPCNLHAVWDSAMIAHRQLGDLQYLAALQQLIRHKRLDKEPFESPRDWAMESHALAKRALVPAFGKIDDQYYEQHIRVIDRRLALGGLRLAALLNRGFNRPPPNHSN